MVVTDMTTSENRADALGKLGVSYGVGMVIGPFVGGIVNTKFGSVKEVFFNSFLNQCFFSTYKSEIIHLDIECR